MEPVATSAVDARLWDYNKQFCRASTNYRIATFCRISIRLRISTSWSRERSTLYRYTMYLRKRPWGLAELASPREGQPHREHFAKALVVQRLRLKRGNIWGKTFS
jgi:hypothetical protein